MKRWRSNWFKLGLGGLVACLAVFLFFVWRLALEPGKDGGQEIVAGGQKQSSETSGILPRTAELGTPKEPEFKPFIDQESEKIKNDFLKRFSDLTNPPVSAPKAAFSAPAKTEAPEQPTQEFLQPAKPRRVLTDEEWFKIAYPDYYLDALKGIEQFMRQQGFLATSEKFEFKTEKEIYAFAYRMMDFALAKNIIDESQAKNFRHGLEMVLPELQKDERNLWAQQLSILLENIFGTKIAWALGSDCYRQGVSTGSGSNTPWPICCNCGTGYVGETIMYYTDCGYGLISSITCNVSELGCLNSVCKFPKPAIWDRYRHLRLRIVNSDK